mmetsp:Transcript_51764/g.134735  ORF Transcript_51764/g.134735 Transcript_51764/m.134735 type:complete len:282 (-) Transcript_51764:1270-2115(-)
MQSFMQAWPKESRRVASSDEEEQARRAGSGDRDGGDKREAAAEHRQAANLGSRARRRPTTSRRLAEPLHAPAPRPGGGVLEGRGRLAPRDVREADGGIAHLLHEAVVPLRHRGVLVHDPVVLLLVQHRQLRRLLCDDARGADMPSAHNACLAEPGALAQDPLAADALREVDAGAAVVGRASWHRLVRPGMDQVIGGDVQCVRPVGAETGHQLAIDDKDEVLDKLPGLTHQVASGAVHEHVRLGQLRHEGVYCPSEQRETADRAAQDCEGERALERGREARE